MITPLGSRYGIQGALGRSVKRASETSWWLAGGIDPTNCVAAYQAKGAASYAASKVNLANPGTYDATEGSAPSWDVTNGWMFDGTNNYLDSNVNPVGTNKQYSVFIKYTNLTLGSGELFGMYLGDSTSLRIASAIAASMHTYSSGYYLWKHSTLGITPINGVIAIAGDKFYYNASEQFTFPSGSNLSNKSLYIGTCNNAYNPSIIYMQALAIYNTPVTSAQVSALTDAMNAL